MSFNRILFRQKPFTIRWRKNYYSLFRWQIPCYRLRIGFDGLWLCRRLPFPNFWVAEYTRWQTWQLFFLLPALPFVIFYTTRTMRRSGYLSADVLNDATLWGISIGAFLILRLLLAWIERACPRAIEPILTILRWTLLIIFLSVMAYKLFLAHTS